MSFISNHITLHHLAKVWWNVPRRLWAHRSVSVGGIYEVLFASLCLCRMRQWEMSSFCASCPQTKERKEQSSFQWASANLHLHSSRSISEKKSKTYIFKFLRIDIYLISYFFLNLCENLELGCCLKRAQSKPLPKFKNWQNHFDHLYIHTHKYTKLYVFYNYQTLTFITATHKHFDQFTHTILLTVSWSSDTQMT